ncbi:MAG: MBL fold metallo-hydrolase [Verrucomicrobia bacterium]|nr:MBL fold metallo-hydrolase [Verrucomicrobiota bacterium]
MKRGNQTKSLTDRVSARDVPAGQVIAWWLGGSGFIFKTSDGIQLYVDPYLSDIANDIFDQPRAFPPPLTADEARPDLLICSHWHEDHLDPGSIPIIAKNNPKAQLLMPPSAMSRALSWGVPRRQITPLKSGQSLTFKDIRLSAVAARHNAGVAGWEVYDGVCLLLEIEGLKIFFSGDTEYDTGLRKLRPLGIQVAFLCINGVGGNMNACEAALLGWQWGATILVPMHHYLWQNPAQNDEATLDPQLMESTYLKLGGLGRVIHPTVGGEIVLRGSLGGRKTRRRSQPGALSFIRGSTV